MEPSRQKQGYKLNKQFTYEKNNFGSRLEKR